MSTEHYAHIEQDRSSPPGADELPTYDDLAAQNGPNSRFGRWRGWIEKRAAERYADITPEERIRRRERGWEIPDATQASSSSFNANEPPAILYTQPPPFPPPPPPPLPLPLQHSSIPLHIQTSNLSLQDSPLTIQEDAPPPPLPFLSQTIEPSHLKINHFGSRFLPHTTSQVRCILPLLAGHLILIGHDEGLSVLDMFPQDWTDQGEITMKGPNDAQARLIWHGEAVYQMSILELENYGEGSPQGVVLALVGSESGNHRDGDFHSLRMYNLGSLTKLAKWAVAHKGARPLDLQRPSHWQTQQHSPRKHRHQGSIARSIKSLMIDSPQLEPTTSSYQSLLTSPSNNGPNLARTPPASERGSPTRHNSDDSTWDVVDEMPLRWATDYVPLASPGSRLANTSVLFYATWSDENRRSTGGQLLAIATKNSILLYESPKGERMYRFVKDFYTPLLPKSIAFFQQVVQDTGRSSLDSPGKHRRTDSGNTIRAVINEQANNTGYGSQLSLFVVFDKKAGWIRLADSAVGEFELRDDGGPPPNLSSGNGSSLASRDSLTPSIGSMTQRTRSRLSFEIRERAAKWVLPVKCELPLPSSYNGRESSPVRTATRSVYMLTRGRRTHILPCPLPSKSPTGPLHVIYWKNCPKQISARICRPSRRGLTAPPPRLSQDKPSLLQVTAFGEAGLEVYETSLAFLSSSSSPSVANGKGKSPQYDYEFTRAEEDLGEDAGFLLHGGNWDQVEGLYGAQGLQRADSMVPSSASSFSSLESDDLAAVLKEEAGMYGWYSKGLGDYRIFWVGGSYDDADSTVEDDDDDFYV